MTAAWRGKVSFLQCSDTQYINHMPGQLKWLKKKYLFFFFERENMKVKEKKKEKKHTLDKTLKDPEKKALWNYGFSKTNKQTNNDK